MSISFKTAAAAMLSISCVSFSFAQESVSDKELEKKRLEVEVAKIELEKKKVELETVMAELKAKEVAGRLTMQLEGDVLFEFGKSEVRPEAEQSLQKVAVVLSQFPDGRVSIRGYTDAKGSPEANLALSRKRAAAVKSWLVKKGEATDALITTEGFGEQNPVAENKNADGSDNPSGRQQNRRVEITVEKASAAR